MTVLRQHFHRVATLCMVCCATLVRADDAPAGTVGGILYGPVAGGTTTAVPTVGQWTLIVLALLVAALGYRMLRRNVPGNLLSSLIVVATATGMALHGGQLGSFIKVAGAAPPAALELALTNVNGATAYLTEYDRVYKVTNSSDTRQKIIRLLPDIGFLPAAQFTDPSVMDPSYSPQCSQTTILEPDANCYVYLDTSNAYEEEVRLMWDVWFDTKDAQSTTPQTPLVLDLDNNGAAGITGSNILGDGKIDGPTVLFDMFPESISFNFKSDKLPGHGSPEATGGHWTNADGNPGADAPQAGADGKYKAYTGWSYLDADGTLVGQIRSDGLYHYGSPQPREITEWLSANGGDGFLASDDNGDGQINDITELFGMYGSGGPYANGFEKLTALYDTNGDGQISGDELDGLLVWKDSNANAQVDPGELLPVSAYGIINISTVYDSNMMTGSFTVRVPRTP